MVRNSIEDYAAVFGPLVTMIEYAFIVSHGTKESIIIRFITLGNDYFNPSSQVIERPIFEDVCRITVPGRPLRSYLYCPQRPQWPIF